MTGKKYERRPSRTTSAKRRACLDEAAFYQPKKLMMFSATAFIFAIFVARFYSALQMAGYIGTGINVVGEFHFHHWAISLIALAVLLPLGFLARNNKPSFAFVIIFMAFFMGLFLDGIVYENSSEFFGEGSSSTMTINAENILVLAILGLILFVTIIVTVIIHFQDKNNCNI